MDDFKFNHIDEVFMALTIWREARGDGYEGMQAVANVIKNNAEATQHSVYVECTSPNRFSSMVVHSDPQTTKFPYETEVDWKMAQSIALGVLSGVIRDNSQGARYYCVAGKETSNEWFKKYIFEDSALHPFLVRIGHQNFYK